MTLGVKDATRESGELVSPPSTDRCVPRHPPLGWPWGCYRYVQLHIDLDAEARPDPPQPFDGVALLWYDESLPGRTAEEQERIGPLIRDDEANPSHYPGWARSTSSSTAKRRGTGRAGGLCDRSPPLHQLRMVPRSMPDARRRRQGDRRRPLRDRTRLVHRLRPLRADLPGRLHRSPARTSTERGAGEARRGTCARILAAGQRQLHGRAAPAVDAPPQGPARRRSVAPLPAGPECALTGWRRPGTSPSRAVPVDPRRPRRRD